MLGLIVLLIALLLHFTGYRRYSLLLFVFMALRYMSIVPMTVMVVNGIDLAIVYMIIVTVSQRIQMLAFTEDYKLKDCISRLSLFLIISFAVGMIYYGLTPFQSFMGCRQLWLFPAYFFLRDVPKDDIIWLFKALYFITLIHALLYIIQCSTGLPVLGVAAPEYDRITHTLRYNNHPVYMTLFFYLSLLFPNYIGNKISKFSAIVFAAAAFITMTRTIIVFVVLFTVLGIYLSGKKSTILKFSIIGAILFIPLSDALLSRFGEKAGTQGDISALVNGRFIDYAHTAKAHDDVGTLTYRFAWVYERAEYMLTNGIVESVFGLGFLPPSEPEVAKRLYNFKIGLAGNNKIIGPTFTPDIGYGNIIAQYGFLGAFFFISLWVRLLKIHSRNRENHPIIFCMYLYLMTLFALSISGQGISLQGMLILPYLTSNLALISSSKEESIHNY